MNNILVYIIVLFDFQIVAITLIVVPTFLEDRVVFYWKESFENPVWMKEVSSHPNDDVHCVSSLFAIVSLSQPLFINMLQ